MKEMKVDRKQILLLIVGIVCLPISIYKYYTIDKSDIKYLIGIVLSVWLIYDYYIYKTNNPHILKNLKKYFRNQESKL